MKVPKVRSSVFFLLSGEGPSDMGTCGNGAGFCRLGTQDDGFQLGPMALLVDILAERKLGYSPKEYMAMGFVSESEIAREKRKRPRLFMSLPKSEEKGALYHKVYAGLLGGIALEMAAKEKIAVVPVFFRDCDGSRSSPSNEWERKKLSIAKGFKQANCPTGVAMVPKPKSECWILCAVQKPPYRNCAALEDLSGNDASPERSLKKLLEQALGKKANAAVQSDLIKRGKVDPARIDMPSFNAFKSDFDHALDVARSWEP